MTMETIACTLNEVNSLISGCIQTEKENAGEAEC